MEAAQLQAAYKETRELSSAVPVLTPGESKEIFQSQKRKKSDNAAVAARKQARVDGDVAAEVAAEAPRERLETVLKAAAEAPRKRVRAKSESEEESEEESEQDTEQESEEESEQEESDEHLAARQAVLDAEYEKKLYIYNQTIQLNEMTEFQYGYHNESRNGAETRYIAWGKKEAVVEELKVNPIFHNSLRSGLHTEYSGKCL